MGMGMGMVPDIPPGPRALESREEQAMGENQRTFRLDTISMIPRMTNVRRSSLPSDRTDQPVADALLAHFGSWSTRPRDIAGHSLPGSLDVWS